MKEKQEENNEISPVNIRFVESFHELLKLKKVATKKEFMNAIDLPEQYFTRLNSGTMPINLQIVENLNKKFKVSKQWLLQGKGEMFVKPKEPWVRKGEINLVNAIKSEIEQEQPVHEGQLRAAFLILFNLYEEAIQQIQDASEDF